VGDTLSVSSSSIGFPAFSCGWFVSGGTKTCPITDPGSGYTASTTYPGVALTGGSGTGAIATIVVNAYGEVASVTITNAGSHYVNGDVLSAAASALGGTAVTPFVYTVNSLNALTKAGGNINSANPLRISSNLPTPSPGGGEGPLYNSYVLEDSFGNYNPGAWTDYVQQEIGGLNQNATPWAMPINNVLQQAAFSFTGSIAPGTSSIKGSNLMPAPGWTVYDSASCLAPSGNTLQAISYAAGLIYISATSQTMTAGCSSDTLTITNGTITDTIPVTIPASTTPGYSVIANMVSPPSLTLGIELTDSKGCIPPNSWLSGYNLGSVS